MVGETYLYQVYNDEYLAHHGIKGMHWGIRRFRNTDGSLTNAGRARYNVNLKATKRAYKDAKLAYKLDKSNSNLGAYKAAKERLKNDKIRKKLNKEDSVSKHRQNLESKYMKKGFTQEEAQIKAYKRDRAEKIFAAAAVTTIAAAAAYAVYKNGANKKARAAEKIISSDTPLKRIQGSESRELHDVFYATHEKSDSAKYAGMYGMEVGAKTKGAVFQSSIKTKGLKVASHNTAREALASHLKRNPQDREELMKAIDAAQKSGKAKTPAKILLEHRAKRDLKMGRVTDAVYDFANNRIVETHGQDSISKGMFSRLKSQGYHAIQDVHDQRYSGYDAKSPVIVFDKARTAVESVKQLDISQVNTSGALGSGQMYVKQAAPVLGVTAVSAAGVVGAKKAVNNRNVSNYVSEYRKQHPNTRLTYEGIIKTMYKKK